MTISKKRLAVSLLASIIILSAILAVNIFASSPVYCVGGGGIRRIDHTYYDFSSWPWVKDCYYYEFYHDVDRVYNSHVYAVTGHPNCGGSTWGNPNQTSCIGTIVAYG
jgi:hypothetical protein